MGLAASQARLLTITARLTDNELRSQTINNAKMRLATQSSQASENYINALNNATYQFTNYDLTGGLVTQPLTFNALTAYSPYNTQYGLINAAGQLLVSENEAKLFIAANGNLDDYLKSHHLVYGTSYFEQIGKINSGSIEPDTVAIQNPNYPEPFDEITIKELQEYYEGYNGYQNSVEVEKFNKSYSAFNSKTNDLKKYGAYVFESYLLHGADEIIQREGKNYIYAGSTDNMLAAVKNAFRNSNYNFNINTLYENGYIPESIYEDLQGALDSITEGAGGSWTNTEECSISDPKEGTIAGSSVYSIDSGDLIITVGDTLGTIINYNWTGLQTYYESQGIEFNPGSYDPSTSSFHLSGEFFSYTTKETTEDGKTLTSTHKYRATKDDDGNYVITTSYTVNDDDTKAALINEMIDYIMNSILYAGDYEKFAEFLKNTDATTLEDNYGVDINAAIPGTDGKTMIEILNAYIEAKEEFFKTIFDDDSIEKVKEDLTNHTLVDMFDENGDPLPQAEVNVDNLQDIDFLLQYIAHNEDINYSENFETVIKEYLIDNMIDQYGTPKYAWVDELDKSSNQENADAKAQWYTNLFKRMQQGYKALENGLASSKEWIEYALESGTVYMEQVDGSFAWNALDYKTCSRIIEETDDKAVAKAEAEYNRAMNDIKAKDSIYDLELKNIDTEHNALQTEYDVIKGVINKNIERNFKFNQSA